MCPSIFVLALVSDSTYMVNINEYNLISRYRVILPDYTVVTYLYFCNLCLFSLYFHCLLFPITTGFDIVISCRKSCSCASAWRSEITAAVAACTVLYAIVSVNTFPMYLLNALTFTAPYYSSHRIRFQCEIQN